MPPAAEEARRPACRVVHSQQGLPRMARLPIDKSRLHRLGGAALARYIQAVYRSCRLVTEPADLAGHLHANHPMIMAMWHGQFMMLPKIDPGGVGVRIMVARHGDAAIIGEALTRFDMELIRGAGAGARQRDRGGATALREALRSLADGYTVAMTADIPPGPARKAGPGIVTLARMAGRPVVPAAVATTRYRALDTWSRFTINLPFGALAMVAGDPIDVPRDLDEAGAEAMRRRIEAALDAVTARAYALAGADIAASLPAGASGAVAPPAPVGLPLKSYRAGMRLAQRAAPLVLGLRARRGKEDPARQGERLGIASRPRPVGRLVWMHAASVGETNAALPVFQAMCARRGDLRLLLTTGTVTSAALAAQRLRPEDIHQYLPIDTPEFTARFLEHWRPDLAVLTESEIWPSLILAVAEQRVPLALVNARMSKRSFGRWSRLGSVSRPLFTRIDLVLAQNEKIGRWFTSLGCRRVEPVGNLKIDAPPPPRDDIAHARLRQALGKRPVIVAASTHDGEEAIIAAAHRRIAAAQPGLCTIIAPRHPERGPAIAAQLAAEGLGVALRSSGALPEPATDIYIADTIGELGTLFSAAPIAFLGKSLIAGGGGQNPIEAVRHGAVVVSGPEWSNFKDAYAALQRHGGFVQVRSADELATAIVGLLADPTKVQRIVAGAEAALASLSGALERTVAALLPLIPPEEEFRRAS